MTLRWAGSALLSCVVLGLSALAQSPAQVQPTASAALTEPALVQIEVSPRMMTALYHRATCPWLRASHSQVRQFEIAEAKKRYYQPHCECITGKDGIPPCAHAAATAREVETAAPALPATTPAPLLEKPASVAAPTPRPAAPQPTPVVTRCQVPLKRTASACATHNRVIVLLAALTMPETKRDEHECLQQRTNELKEEHSELALDRTPLNKADHDQHTERLKKHAEDLRRHRLREDG